MRMQVILDSSFARPGSAPIWGGKKGEFRDWTIDFHIRDAYGAPLGGPSGRRSSALIFILNSRFARCRHLTTTTRIPFDFSLLFKF